MLTFVVKTSYMFALNLTAVFYYSRYFYIDMKPFTMWSLVISNLLNINFI